jgi:endonuclease III
MKVLRDDLMVQQQVANSWEHMIGVICLNQSHRKPVKRVLPALLKQYPTPERLLRDKQCTAGGRVHDPTAAIRGRGT